MALALGFFFRPSKVYTTDDKNVSSTFSSSSSTQTSSSSQQLFENPMATSSKFRAALGKRTQNLILDLFLFVARVRTADFILGHRIFDIIDTSVILSISLIMAQHYQ